jgi:hypothetical protein
MVVSSGPYWFGRVLTRQTVAELAAWIRAGGPKATLPETLEQRKFRPRPLESTAASLGVAHAGDGGA